METGGILLLENTRFHKGEEKNEPDFVKALAANGDIFVNDAFSAAHRAHASTEGLAHHLPAYAGRTMQAELEALEKGLGNPTRPVVAIVGGAKVSTKIDLLKNLVKKVDALVIGGGMANTFLAAQGIDVGKSLCEHDLADTARADHGGGQEAGCDIVLPVDGVVAREFKAGAANQTVSVERHSGRRDDARCRPGIGGLGQCLDRQGAIRWSGTARSAHSRSSPSTRRPFRPPSMPPRKPRPASSFGRGRRRYGLGTQPCRRGRRFHLCLDCRRRVPRMDGRQAASRRRRAEQSKITSGQMAGFPAILLSEGE